MNVLFMQISFSRTSSSCVVGVIFLFSYSVFSLFDEHSKCSGHFLKICPDDPQHNFFCIMYFFTDNFLLLDKCHKAFKCGQHKLVIFIYFK